MLEALVGLLPHIGDLLKNSIKRRRLLDDQGQHAVESILRAVNETKLYLASLARHSPRDIDREANLARNWTETAAALHGIDDDLAKRCRLKGEYWADPHRWDEKQLKRARILLAQVATDADILLGWKEG